MANGKALVLVEGPADKLKEVEAETLRNKAATRSNSLVEVKIELIVHTLDESVAQLVAEKLSETVKAQRLIDALTDKLAEVVA